MNWKKILFGIGATPGQRVLLGVMGFFVALCLIALIL